MTVVFCSDLLHKSCAWTESYLQPNNDECLENKKLEPFPILRERRVGKVITIQVEVFCYCRSPNNGSGIL